MSHDTIECLEALLADARQGQILGLAFGALYIGKRYIVHTVGECHLNRTFTRGMVRDLDQLLESASR